MENPFEFNGFTFTMTHPTLLPTVFQYIEPGLMEIQRKARLEFDIMIIPTLISANQATLTIIYRRDNDQERYAGFVVTQSVFLGVPPRHYLKVMAPYVERWVHEEGFDGVAAIDTFATEWAKTLKCRGVVETAARPGWLRRLDKLGYQVVESTTLKILDYDAEQAPLASN